MIQSDASAEGTTNSMVVKEHAPPENFLFSKALKCYFLHRSARFIIAIKIILLAYILAPPKYRNYSLKANNFAYFGYNI